MYAIYKTNSSGIQEIQDFEKHCWVNIWEPSNMELSSLASRLNVPLYFMTDCLDIDERPRIEKEDAMMLIVIRIPHSDPEVFDLPYVTLPLGIIIANDMIITICSRQPDIVTELTVNRIKNFSTENHIRFLLHVLLKISLAFQKNLKQMNNIIHEIEVQLHKSSRNEELIRLLKTENSLIYFSTSLRSNQIMIDRLFSIIPPNDEYNQDLLEDVLVENKQAIEITNIYSNIMSGLMGAFASLVSNNLSRVMRILTSITIVLMLPTLMASIYGMNVKLPLQDSPSAFFIIMGMSVSLASIAAAIFIKKNYF